MSGTLPVTQGSIQCSSLTMRQLRHQKLSINIQNQLEFTITNLDFSSVCWTCISLCHWPASSKAFYRHLLPAGLKLTSLLPSLHVTHPKSFIHS